MIPLAARQHLHHADTCLTRARVLDEDRATLIAAGSTAEQVDRAIDRHLVSATAAINAAAEEIRAARVSA